MADAAITGFELNDTQAAMVGDLATSGIALQLAAPAGTGKISTMRVLSRAWHDADGRVIGRAPSTRAAHELSHAIHGHTDTLAHVHLDPGQHVARPMGPAGSSRSVPDAGDHRRGRPGLHHLTRSGHRHHRTGWGRAAGRRRPGTRLGWWRLHAPRPAAVGASTLSEVHRFREPAEAAATLAAREGDAGALGFYADSARIHVGGIGAVTDQAWAADCTAGPDSILLDPPAPCHPAQRTRPNEIAVLTLVVTGGPTRSRRRTKRRRSCNSSPTHGWKCCLARVVSSASSSPTPSQRSLDASCWAESDGRDALGSPLAWAHAAASRGWAAHSPRYPRPRGNRTSVSTYAAYDRDEAGAQMTRTGSSQHGSLPHPTTSFVGRREVASSLKRALESSRLVTLTGPGGVGKTRLALYVADQARRGFRDGVHFVDLAKVQDSSLVVQATAVAMDLRDQSARSSQAALIVERLPGR